MLTQANLQTALSTIFGVDASFIVPMQGDWFNAQSVDPTKGTWIAFMRQDSRIRVMPYKINDPDQIIAGPIQVAQYLSKIKLQIVGNVAENLANSVAFWLYRDDVTAAFDAIECQLAADSLGSYVVSNFMQDGLNSVWAYNIEFNLQWASFLYQTQEPITSADLGGSVIVNG